MIFSDGFGFQREKTHQLMSNRLWHSRPRWGHPQRCIGPPPASPNQWQDAAPWIATQRLVAPLLKAAMFGAVVDLRVFWAKNIEKCQVSKIRLTFDSIYHFSESVWGTFDDIGKSGSGSNRNPKRSKRRCSFYCAFFDLEKWWKMCPRPTKEPNPRGFELFLEFFSRRVLDFFSFLGCSSW